MHQRVQMAPVAIRAPFWVRESFSAGRLKSEIPAMTRAHCINQHLVISSPLLYPPISYATDRNARERFIRTFMTGALSTISIQFAIPI